MGDQVIHCDGGGMGARMKIVNNYMSVALNVLSAEALVMAEASGLDVEVAREVMNGTTAGRGHLSTTYPAQVLQGNVQPGSMVDLADKDMGLALEFAGRLGVPAARRGADPPDLRHGARHGPRPRRLDADLPHGQAGLGEIADYSGIPASATAWTMSSTISGLRGNTQAKACRVRAR